MIRKILVIIISIFFVSNISLGQIRSSSTTDFEYEDCGCSGEVDLTIYNGLKPPYGGQVIDEIDEHTLGAVTVANKNDTDGDGLIDYNDNSVVSGVGGRDEVDLMRLDISIVGDIPPECGLVKLNIVGPLTFWSSSQKVHSVNSTVLGGFSTNLLPMTVWVEAQEESIAVGDMSIQAVLLDMVNNNWIEYDEVIITSLWVEKITTYFNRTSIPTASSLGIDNMTMIDVFQDLHKAIDGSIYGFGYFRETSFPFVGQTDWLLGGRILFEFKLLPLGIQNKLSEFGIIYDITRRKQKNNVILKYGQVPSVDVELFPPKNEQANDDSEQPLPGGPSDFLDEDTEPTADRIFSYDAASHFRSILHPQNNVLNPAFYIRRFDFEEFARVSFNQDCSGNITAGSRCSSKFNWELEYGSENNMALDPNDPYNSLYQLNNNYQTISGGIRVSLPRRPYSSLGLNGSGNGDIDITPLANATSNSYILSFTSSDIWEIRRKDSSGTTLIGQSLSSSTGPWTITVPNIVEIEIIQGSIPFEAGKESLFFCIFDSPVIFPMLNSN